MLTGPDNYYLKQEEPLLSCLLALKDIILGIDNDIIHTRKYRIPFFYYNGKKLAFLWVQRKKVMVGFIQDKQTLPEIPGIRRKDRVETILLDPDADIPVEYIMRELQKRLQLYAACPVADQGKKQG